MKIYGPEKSRWLCRCDECGQKRYTTCGFLIGNTEVQLCLQCLRRIPTFISRKKI
jgi:hypothetical protein